MKKRNWKKVQVVEGWASKFKGELINELEPFYGTLHVPVRKYKRDRETWLMSSWPPKKVRITVEVLE